MSEEKKQNLDDNQIKAVHILKNAVVSAGAGSGKTTVLASRFTYLVTGQNYDVDQILTLTFTRKATVEMKGRIFRTLRKAADNGNENAAQAVRDFDKAQIQTLDSYCASIARQGAHFYGITPQFKIDNQQAEKDLRNKAFPFLLENRDNDAIQTMTLTTKLTDMAQKFFVEPIKNHSAIASPIDFDGDMKKQIFTVQKAWKKHTIATEGIIQSISMTFDSLPKKRSQTAANLESALHIAHVVPQEISVDDIEKGDSSSMEEYLRYLGNFTSFTFRLDTLKEPMHSLFDEIDILMSIANYVAGFPIAKQAAHLLSEFQEKVAQEKRSSGIMTFSDIADLARHILLEHPEIRQIEKEKYRAIMIDEFQDNNILQRDILFMLAEKRSLKGRVAVPSVDELENDKLFFVGDEKQSIYRFRGADVSVFRELKDSFSEGNLELETNYRSHPALISSFNAMFGGLCYGAADKKIVLPSVFLKNTADKRDFPAFEAEYHTAHIPKSTQIEDNMFSRRRVHIALFANIKGQVQTSDDMSADENEAAYVARKIKELIQQGYKPSDIALLFRKTSKQHVFERMLLSYGIPYSTETLKGFFSDGPVNDMFSYLCLCVSPDDKNAYAKVLCSPFVSLSVDEACAVLSCGAPPFAKGAASELTKESAQRFIEAGKRFEVVRSSFHSQEITKTLSYLWYEAGYRYETLWNSKVEMYASLYDMLFELARLSDEKMRSLTGFIDDIRAYQDKESKHADELDIPLEERDSVRILTIHKSKGLEFPVVFVCGITDSTKKDSNSEPFYFSDMYGISVNTPPCAAFKTVKSKGKNRNKKKKTTNYFYEKIRDEEDAKTEAELKRLVYVAFTRAEHELYVTGKFEGSFNAEKLKPAKNIYEEIEPLLSFYAGGEKLDKDTPFDFEYIQEQSRSSMYMYTAIEGADAVANTPSEKKKFITDIAPVISGCDVVPDDNVPKTYISPSSLHAPDDDSSFAAQVLDTHSKEIYSDSSYYDIDNIIESIDKDNDNEKDSFGYSDFGSIVHAYMEDMIISNGNVPKSDMVFQKLFAKLKYKTSKISSIQHAASVMADRFKLSELGKQVFSQDCTWKKAEYSFKSRIGDIIVKGTMDLVYKKQDDSYVIVDYKTNRMIKPEMYYAQLSCYRQAVSQIAGCADDNIRCFLYYVRFDRVIDITSECTLQAMSAFLAAKPYTQKEQQ